MVIYRVVCLGEVIVFDAAFVKRIQDALGTAEEGEALIEVARRWLPKEIGC